MDSISTTANEVFDYHRHDNVDAPMENPYPAGSFEAILYSKNWVDAVQWHLEDIIRDPDIDPKEALELKRRIDRSNQVRTDMVEDIDTWMRDRYKDVRPGVDATINSGLGTRPPLDSRPQDLAHARAGGAHRCRRGASGAQPRASRGAA